MDEFKKHYMGRIYLNNMRREFHNLKQRQSSVTEYVREFTRLSKYAPEMLVSEEEKFCKFEDGLSDHIRAHVIGFCHDDFSKITTCALNVERVKKEENERKDKRQGKKNPGQSSAHQQQSKRLRGPQDPRQPTAQATGRDTILSAPSIASAQGGASRGQDVPRCSHCGRKHKGDCWRLTGACLGCGSMEHKIRECTRARLFTAPQTGGNVSSVQKGSKSVASSSVPRQGTQILARQDGRAPARAYAMKAIEDTDAQDVIIVNFTIFDTIVHALIDPRSTHSYVCTDIPNLGRLPRSETEYDILVTNPLGHSVIVNKVYRDSPIRIIECEFLGDLIELSFKEFDMILGMDWLSRHRAMVDCRMKRMTLRTLNEDEVIFIRERSNHLSNVIFAATARTTVRKGYEAYLAYVIDTVD